MPSKEETKKLSTGTSVYLNNERVRVDLPQSMTSYETISSAILNGGCRTIPSSPSASPPTAPAATTTTHVINCKVPGTYDGVSPAPLGLLSNFCERDGLDPGNTIGMLTAASMETLSTASRTARGVNVDAIVTAGLSNARRAGADADYFAICENDDDGEEEDERKTRPGTINSIVIIDAPLSPEARAEAYAIAIEAKCAACVDHGVMCAKSKGELATGTGTDCCVVMSPCRRRTVDKNGDDGVGRVIKYAGKHTLFAEMVGQAVYEATSESIMINIRHLHGNYAVYTVRRWIQILTATMKGARPCIPPKPMDPMPRAPISVVLLGVCSVLFVRSSPLPDKAKLLLAAAAWDRYLGEPPLRLHPVCLAGSAISTCLSLVPDKVYKSSVLGFFGGFVLLVSMLFSFTYGAWMLIQCADALSDRGPMCLNQICLGHCSGISVNLIFNLAAWIIKLLLVKSTFSLQLLCTVSLQMARFLEREQIQEARAQLSWLCSRDPSKLGSSELAGGTLESLSENLSDGFVAPLFWYVLLGPVGAVGYRTANTLDSRIGYRGKYEWLGKASARFDDAINVVPARATALLLVLAAPFVRGCGAGPGLRTAWNDHGRCESPNAGWPMACFAGVLGVRLEKQGSYRLGSSGVEPGPADIRAGHRVAQIAGGMAVLLAALASSIV